MKKNKFVYVPPAKPESTNQNTTAVPEATASSNSSNIQPNAQNNFGTLILPPNFPITEFDSANFGSFAGPIPETSHFLNNNQAINMNLILGHRVNIAPTKPNQ